MSSPSGSRGLTRLLSAALLVLQVGLLIGEPPLQAAAPDPAAQPRGSLSPSLFPLFTGLEPTNPVRPLVLQALTEQLRQPLLLAQAYDAGTAVGQGLLPGVQRPTQGQVDQVPNYSSDALNGALGNKYYIQQPAGPNTADPLGNDAAGSTDPVLGLVQGGATNPNAWYFNQSSDLLQSLNIRAPAHQDIPPNSCGTFQYCVQPGPVQEPHDCEVNREYEEGTCQQYYQQVTTCNPLDQSGSRAFCDDHYMYAKLVTDPATGNLQLLVLDTGPGGEWHKNCGGSGDVGGWWLLATLPPTQDVPLLTFDTSGGGCSTVHTTLHALDTQTMIGQCGSGGAQSLTIQWSAHADNCATWSEYIDECTPYAHAPWFAVRHQCLNVVPGDSNDCGLMQRTYGQITSERSTCQPWIDQGCTLTGAQCESDPCTVEDLTYSCTVDSCQQWGQALLCSACVPDPPGPPKCTDTTTPINTDFGLATATMEGQVTFSHDLRHEDAVRAFPGTLQVCKSNLLINCCNTEAAKQLADNVNAAIQATQLTMQAYRLASIAYSFAWYVDTMASYGVELGQAITQAASMTYTDFVAGMFSFSWTGAAVIVVMVAVMVLQMLMQCDEASTETAAKINLRLCIPVGSYCATKVLAGCWSTAHAHCCYSALLSRILEEQAHGPTQLNIGWGSPQDASTCQGLTVDQLQAMDWNRIDWSEYITDLQQRILVPTAASVTAQTPGVVSQTDFLGQAATTINTYGSLGDRVAAAITVPGQGTLPDASHPATAVLYVALHGPGTVTVTPGDQSCPGGTCTLTLPVNTPLTLTATPASLTTFSGWSGDCTGTDPCPLILQGPGHVEANFTSAAYRVTVTADGPGTVISSPAALNCPGTCAAAFPPQAMVSLLATPNATATFSGWSGACQGQGAICTLQVTGNLTAHAGFVQLPQIATFTPQSPDTVKVGVPMVWTVGVSGGLPPVQVQFIREDNGIPVTVQDFGPSATYTWTPTVNDIAGNPHRIQAAVRNAGSSSPGDDFAITDSFSVIP